MRLKHYTQIAQQLNLPTVDTYPLDILTLTDKVARQMADEATRITGLKTYYMLNWQFLQQQRGG